MEQAFSFEDELPRGGIRVGIPARYVSNLICQVHSRWCSSSSYHRARALEMDRPMLNAKHSNLFAISSDIEGGISICTPRYRCRSYPSEQSFNSFNSYVDW